MSGPYSRETLTARLAVAEAKRDAYRRIALLAYGTMTPGPLRDQLAAELEELA